MTAQDYFKQAILEGRLSENPSDKHYAGNYMFMGLDLNGKPAFKHYSTREYLK